MRTEIIWSQKGGEEPVYQMCTTADGEKIFVVADNKIRVISQEGEIIRTIDTTHTQISYIAGHPTDQKIISVGLDNQVIFMDTSGTALFKYGHSTEIQCCAYSPNGQYFLTGADGDIGIYSNGAQRVNKIRTDAVIRACAWSPSSQWFVIATEAGVLIFLDIEGKEFNRCDCGAPIWSMKVVPASLFKQVENEAQDDDPEIQLNEVGVYQQGQKKKEEDEQKSTEFKTSPTAEAFIREKKVDEERLLLVSWDQKYRVINPGSLAHSGVLIQQKRAFSGKKSRKLQDKDNPFLIAEARLPFIPLCFELIRQYAIVGGVGGKIVILSAETGAQLLDMYQINEMDQFLIQCPRSIFSQKNKAADQQQFRDAMAKAQKDREEHTLSYFGLNNVWIYSLLKIEPNLLAVGLNNGTVVCLRFGFNAVDAVYKNFYAVREGLTQIVIRNMNTNSECRLDIGSYVQRIALSNTKLVVMSGMKLDVYNLKDASLQKREVESVLRSEHNHAKRSAISTEFLKEHQIKFKCKQVCVSTEHFILSGSDYVTALTFEGVHTTSWKFKDTQINFCKVVGGISGQENILIGTQDGRVLLLKIGNRFPIEAVRHNLPIMEVDINAHRNLIAVIDSTSKMLVFDYFSGQFKQQASQDPIYQVQNINSCAFDLVLSNVISMASGNKIHICIDGTIVYTHTTPWPNAKILIQNGSCNYNVNQFKVQQAGFGINVVETTEVPLTPNVTYHVKKVYQYLSAGLNFEFYEELDLAIQAAALGVPNQYWMDIATAALFANQIPLAKEALSMIGNVRVLKILGEIQTLKAPSFQYVALALSLVGNFPDAALLYAACGDIQTAIELLFFSRQDGLMEVGPYTSLIGQITQKLINKNLTEYASKNAVALQDLRPLPNLSLYFKLGSAEEEMQKYRQDLLSVTNQQSAKGNKYLEYLQVYEQQPVQAGQNIKNQTYQYSQDFRIMLRRELQALTPQTQGKQELLSRHARFLEQISDWQAASSSWMDAGDCEKAVEVLISNKQTNTLLRLIRVLPAINQKKKDNDDMDEFEVQRDDAVNNQNLVAAFQMVLKYFEANGDFQSALFIAQRLGDQNALLRLFVSQGMWDQVEHLGEIYPEMMPSIHEARAAAYLREGNFMAALERLRLAGNNEKEVAMIRALIDAATVECKFDMARSLICQLQCELISQKNTGEQFYSALKSLRCKILVMSAYIHLMQFIFKTYGSPDPANLQLMNLQQAAFSDPFILTICIFLANYSMLPQEITRIDEHYMSKFESMEFQDQTVNQAQVQETNQFINSSTKPQLGSLSSLDLGGSQRSLPPGIPESIIWIVLSQVSKLSPKLTFQAMSRLLQIRLPQDLYPIMRQRYLKTKASSMKNKEDEVVDHCPRCGQTIDIIQQQILTQRDMNVLHGLPMCSPALSDICHKCGIPLVRSAVSLQILPLILVEPGEDSSILELIEKISSVRIADAKGQVIKADEGLLQRNLQQLLRESPVIEDGRGVLLPKEIYDQIGPTRAFIVADPCADAEKLKSLAVEGVVRRVYVVADETCEVHFCQKCNFFFQAEEFEEAFVMTGKCPVCQNADLLM